MPTWPIQVSMWQICYITFPMLETGRKRQSRGRKGQDTNVTKCKPSYKLLLVTQSCILKMLLQKQGLHFLCRNMCITWKHLPNFPEDISFSNRATILPSQNFPSKRSTGWVLRTVIRSSVFWQGERAAKTSFLGMKLFQTALLILPKSHSVGVGVGRENNTKLNQGQ